MYKRQPLPPPVSGGEAEEGKDNTTPSEGTDENKDESKGETTGEVVTYAATIDGKEGTYETLQAAIDAAENGETVVLAKDVTENININKSITLDLKGKTDVYKRQHILCTVILNTCVLGNCTRVFSSNIKSSAI